MKLPKLPKPTYLDPNYVPPPEPWSEPPIYGRWRDRLLKALLFLSWLLWPLLLYPFVESWGF
jgi:hypothetical protein